MRLATVDYARLAQAEDSEYQQYSPIMNERLSNTKLLEFDIYSPLPISVSDKTFSLMKSLKFLGVSNSKKIGGSVEALNWALREKKKIEHALRELQRLNKQIERIIPLWTAAQVKLSKPESLPPKITERLKANAVRLGIDSHTRLRQLASGGNIEQTDYVLRNQFLEAPLEAHTLTVGRLQVGWKSAQHTVLIEYKDYRAPEATSAEATQTSVQPLAQQLARLLASTGEHDMSTLPFKGILEEQPQQRYAFVFDYPKNTNNTFAPMSLFSMVQLNDFDIRLDLEQRFNVAQILSCTLGAFHADGWVHKSMRSESITFFYRQGNKSLIVDSPYLVNFEFSRPETEVTRLEPDDDLERNLYRHPDRQGPPKISFSKLHDVYALGVVLLEIGLWQTAPSIYKQYVSDLPASAQLTPKNIRSIFVNAARKRLAHHMGHSCLEAVLNCITDHFQDLTSRADFPMIFHEDVVMKLSVGGT